MEKIGITLGDIAGVGPEITLKVIDKYITKCSKRSLWTI